MRRFLAPCVTALAGIALPMAGANAASVTYNLTYSSDDLSHITNTGFVFGDLPHGTVYATVTIDNEGAAGLINFTVATSVFWDGKEDTNFGIDSFGFNVVTPGAASGLVAGDILGLPGNWTADVNFGGITQNGLGMFDVVVDPPSQVGQNRFDPLTFSIDLGLDQSATDTIFDYIADSIPGLNGSFLFAVHIAAFVDQNPDAPVGTCVGQPLDANNQDCNYLTSAWFSVQPAPIPVPAAVWLFGSALGLLAWVRRRAA